MMDGMSIADEFDAAEPADDPATLDIEIDVMFQKKHFTTLHLEEPKAKQVERAEMELNHPSPTAYHFRRYQIALVAAVGKVPIEVVGEMTNSQLRRAWDFLRGRLEPGSPQTGET